MYFHFRSKHALALAIVDEQVERYSESVQNLLGKKLSGLETLIDVAYLIAVGDITQDVTRVMNRIKALYRSWAIPCAGVTVYSPRHRARWLAQIAEPGVRVRAEPSVSVA